ncbi:hypothetical protein Tco_1109606 [Tanacetum coccineum]
MKGSNIGIQEKMAKLLNEWERFTSTDEELIESYRHVTIVHQTKDLHIVDYTQLYDFLKYNQKEVDDLKAERLAKTHDPLALVANSNNPFNYPVFHQDQPSSSTYMQQPQPNNNYNPQPSFNQNYMQQPMPNPEDITDPTTTMNMALVLLLRPFKTKLLNTTKTTENFINPVVQNAVQNLGVQNVGNQNGLIVVSGIANQNPNGNRNVVVSRAEGNAIGNNDRSAEVQNYDNCYDNEIFNMFTQEEQYTELLEPILEPHQVQHNDTHVISKVYSVEQDGGTIDQHPATALELEIEHLLRAVVSQDIMSIMQSKSVANTSILQTELERTKERFDNYIIKNENKYAKLWNDWYKKYGECKYDKISYDKAYNDMQQKIERLQAQLGDLKGKSKDTPRVSNTLDPLSQKLERVDNTAKTRRPQPRGDTMNRIRVPSALRVVLQQEYRKLEVEEHPRNLLLSKNKKHMSYECNNVKLAIWNDKSEVVCAMCKQCLITANDDVCVLNYVNDMNACSKKQKANVSNIANLVMVHRLGLFQAYNHESKASHQFCLEVFGNSSL